MMYDVWYVMYDVITIMMYDYDYDVWCVMYDV
jgi:hypothetical protein